MSKRRIRIQLSWSLQEILMSLKKIKNSLAFKEGLLDSNLNYPVLNLKGLLNQLKDNWSPNIQSSNNKRLSPIK